MADALGQVRIRRSRCLIAYWEDAQFVVENYLTNKQTTIAPLVAHLLQGANDYLPQHSIVERFRPVPHAAELVDRLLARDVLVAEDSALDLKERSIEETWKWKHEARYFHYATKHVVYEPNLEVQRTNLARLAQEVPPPSPFKDYGRSDVKLLTSFDDHAGEFWDVLRARRTQRSFARRAMTLPDFSSLLLWTWGKTGIITDPEVGQHLLKTSPSGGARHPIEVYPMVLRVEGIEPGIYHYSVERHELERLRLGDFWDVAIRLCAHQHWVRDAAAIFFMTAVVRRSMWKYDHARTYRVLLMDAGHLGQTFHLVCTKLGIAPFTTAATLDIEIERELGLDGVSEFPIYVAVAGIPGIHPKLQSARG